MPFGCTRFQGFFVRLLLGAYLSILFVLKH